MNAAPPRPLHYAPALAAFLALGLPSTFLPIGPPLDWWFADPHVFAVQLLAYGAAMWALRVGRRDLREGVTLLVAALAGLWPLARAASEGAPGLLVGPGFWLWALALQPFGWFAVLRIAIALGAPRPALLAACAIMAIDLAMALT